MPLPEFREVIPPDPRVVAELVCADWPRLIGGPLTLLHDRESNRIGAFLRLIIPRSTGLITEVDPRAWPILISGDVLERGEHASVGTALGWWLVLRETEAPSFHEVQFAVLCAIAAGDAHIALALETVQSWVADRPNEFLSNDRDLARACVVLGWCEQIYRAGPGIYFDSPVSTLPKSRQPARGILKLVPKSNVDQVLKLASLAEERMTRPLAVRGEISHNVNLDRPPVRADCDLIVADTLIDIKATMGTENSKGERQYGVRGSLLRQLLGYALLDWEDTHGVRRIGSYAARYGLLWDVDIEQLVSRACTVTPDLPKMREAFAMLWQDAIADPGASGPMPGQLSLMEPEPSSNTTRGA